MAAVTLKIGVTGLGATKTMQFDPAMTVEDVCSIMREKFPEANQGNAIDFGLFLADDDAKKGVWLDASKSLEFYLLRNGDYIEYRKKLRIQKIRTMDGATKTIQLDDSQTVEQLMPTICTKLGISNPEEYSLIHELDDEEKMKTLTLKREKTQARDHKKLEEMKKKLHTEDDVNWLDHSRTLREQGIDPGIQLLLRRKFFFSDSNVDARDPVQLSLLFVQSRDGIIQGTHPVTFEEAVVFAGLQCQAMFADITAGKHKSVGMDLKEYLPREYVKTKHAEKKIMAEYQKNQGMSEVQAKVKYTKLCRALKTYGITFFLVKEKMKGKNKLVPRLLGVTKESIVRMDEKTKEVLRTWPLTTVRRWSASSNSFTLDFGDYSEAYYSVQTQEGEQIAQLIAGYIDIILKKRKDKDHLSTEADEESTMYEDTVAPSKATIIQQQSSRAGTTSSSSVALPGVIRPGSTSSLEFGTGSMGRAQHPLDAGNLNIGLRAMPSARQAGEGLLSEPQKAYLHTLGSGLQTLERSQADLGQKADLPPLGDDSGAQRWRENQFDMSRQNIQAELSAMNAATAQVVTGNDGNETNYTMVGSAVSTISSNMEELSKDIRLLAALQDDSDGDNLLAAARSLASAFSDLLNAAQPVPKENTQHKQQLLSAADRVGVASHELIKHAGDNSSDGERKYEDILLQLARAVADATAALVLKAKDVASLCDEPNERRGVIDSATSCGLATSQLIACVKVVSATIGSPACQEQVVQAARHVARNVENVVGVSQGACSDEPTLSQLGGAASAVNDAVNELLRHIRAGSKAAGDDELDAIEKESSALMHSEEQPSQMVKHAAMLAQASTQLANSIRGEAGGADDSNKQQKLLDAARSLAEATSRLVDAAKGCAGSPADSGKQESLRQAAAELQAATRAAVGDKQRKAVIQRLEIAAKNAAAAATNVVNASRGAAPSNSSENSQQQLNSACRAVAEVVPELVYSIKNSMKQPDNSEVQLQLINTSDNVLQPGLQLSSCAKSAALTVSDPSASAALSNSTRGLDMALEELAAAIEKAHECTGSLEVDGALASLATLQQHMNELEASHRAGKLQPLPGQTETSCALQLAQTCKAVGSTMAQLLTAALQGEENYVAQAARDTAANLFVLLDVVRGVAATAQQPEVKSDVLAAMRDVLNEAEALIGEAKRALDNPQDVSIKQRLAVVAKAASQALSNCVSALSGQRHLETAIRGVAEHNQRLATITYSPGPRPYTELQSEVTERASDLNTAASGLVGDAQAEWPQVARGAENFSTAYDKLIDSGSGLAANTQDEGTRHQVVGGLRNVSTFSSKLLLAAKSMHADPAAPNAKNNLAQAARAVTESVNALINTCTEAAPGQKQCDNVIRQLQMARTMLDSPSEPVLDEDYYRCLEEVMDQSKNLAEAMRGIADASVNSDSQAFTDRVQLFGSAVTGITEAAAHAAYLIGIADPASEPGRVGLVDAAQFSRANQAIQQACEALSNPTSSQQQVLQAATVIAKQTSTLCNICRNASQGTNNPVARRHFVQSAKDVANSTAALVKSIKELDQSFTDENRAACASAAQPLISAVDELCTFASNPEFASVPATISAQARAAQEPIVSEAVSLLEGAVNMMSASKALAVNSREVSSYQQYSAQSHGVSEAIKQLVANIKDFAPGQSQCEAAVERLRLALRRVDEASVRAVSGQLQRRADNDFKGFEARMASCVQEISSQLPILDAGAKGEPEKLGHSVCKLADYFDALTDAAEGMASLSQGGARAQSRLLDCCRTVAEAAVQAVLAAKEGGGNPRARNTHQAIDDTAESLRDALSDLQSLLAEYASAQGIVTDMVDSLQRALTQLSVKKKTPPPVAPKPGRGVAASPAVPSSPQTSSPAAKTAEHQTEMVRLAQNIVRTAQDMVMKSTSDTGQLGPLGNRVTKDFTQMSTVYSSATAGLPSQLCERVQSTLQTLGRGCIELVRDAGELQLNSNDTYLQKQLAQDSRNIAHSVSELLHALQEGARGTQACIRAENAVSSIMADLETTVMFASAGTLHAESSEPFVEHREGILKTARALVNDTKQLVQGAAGTQQQLATAASTSAATIQQLSTVVKQGAAALGPQQNEAQVLLITAVKDVAAALCNLIGSTKSAAGRGQQDPAMTDLKESAKVMVTNVTSLLNTVKSVEDETSRGALAVQAAVEAINQAVKMFDSPVTGGGDDVTATAEELIGVTRQLTSATSKAAIAANSGRQDDVVAAANVGRKAVTELLVTCKAASKQAESAEDREQALRSARACALSYGQLLVGVGECSSRGSAEARQEVVASSRNVARCVTDLVEAAELLKGSDWVDPTDPIVVAETELMGAAKSIEAAAKKLASLEPRQAKQTQEDLPFEGQLLDAARSIAAATAALVKCASAAQRELVSQGRVRASYMQSRLDEDGQWSQGLISAARMVAAATQTLCEAANALVQGTATEERLISASRQVASSTAQLLVACKVKADSNSVSMSKLQKAGNAVKRATEALVSAAQEYQQHSESLQQGVDGSTFVPIFKQELDAAEEILKKEKELEMARRRLENIRKERYKHKNPNEDDDQS